MKRIRVLIVEDSLTVRQLLVEILTSHPEFEVAGEAENGKQAIELCQALQPDVVTLDMMMPVMSGLAATEFIMAYCPTPILIVSSSTNRGELFKTYEALAAGALDVLEKPDGIEPDRVWESRLVAALRLISRIKVITHPKLKLGLGGSPLPMGRALSGQSSRSPRIIAIGASTGGPGAMVEILKNLPTGFPVPILLVMHLGKAFGSSFAEWLAGTSPMPVDYATEGMPLPGPGESRMIMAPPDYHLVVRGGRLRLTREAERHSCRPSIDVLFESLALELGADAAGILLTGMGRDGAAGLLAIHRAGGITLAQDEATSVVFGMPREAILLGAAQKVLPLAQIGPALKELGQGVPT